MDQTLKILLVEDSETDADLLIRFLKKEKIDFRYSRVWDRNAFINALKENDHDLIIADHTLPQFSGMEAFRIMKNENKSIPFILVTGTVSEKILTEYSKEGIDDYILKENLLRLPSAIKQVLGKKKIEQLYEELEIAHALSEKLLLAAEEATEKAQEATRLKEAFLANMSHEIRTPMNAIIGFSDILFKRKLGDQEKEYVGIIKTAGENLLTIIDDILDISKIEAGMMTFEENNFSVKETFQTLYGMLKVKTKEKNLELVFSYDENVPDVLLGDATRLTQIIINLAGNAIKFTESGSVKVHVKVNELTDENTVLEFSVIDTGIGISKDKLEHIFERFRQAESQTTRKYGGTGLGLSIAKQLAELQGGTLSVKSELSKGSIFSFSIPYKKSLVELVPIEIIEKKHNIEELSKLNILLVEDNQLNVKLILSLFSEANLKVEVAENGSVAIEKLKENNDLALPAGHFDIILMDMEMPVMNGYEATIIIRNAMKNKIPIIAMTAHAMAGERERCLDLGMDDYISKPINAALLFEKIHNLTLNSSRNGLPNLPTNAA